MSQHDMDVANGSGATVRADVNSALQALATCFSGAAAPSTTFAFMWWADTANDLLKQRNASNSAWISVMKLSTGAALVATTQSAGVRSTAIATMQSFANEFGSSLAASGYQQLPSGLIIQWGQGVVGWGEVGSISFPISFPTACRIGVASVANNVIGLAASVGNLSNASLQIFHNAGTNQTVNFIAIGN